MMNFVMCMFYAFGRDNETVIRFAEDALLCVHSKIIVFEDFKHVLKLIS